MAFTEKDAVVAQRFGSLGAFVNLVDALNAAVDAVETEFHFEKATDTRQQAIMKKPEYDNKVELRMPRSGEFYGWNATNPQPVAQGTTGS